MPALRNQDVFWDIRGQERAEEQALRQRGEALERAINLGKRAQALRHQPGYEDFLKAIQGCLEGVTRQMLNQDLSDSGLRFQQGRAQALRDVLTLLAKADQNIQVLERQLSEVKEADALFRRPKNEVVS